MKTIYRLFHTADEKGNWYEEVVVSDNFPSDMYGFTEIPIPEGIIFPKWNWSIGEWEEDFDRMKLDYVQKLNKQQEETNQALMELTDLVLAAGGM